MDTTIVCRACNPHDGPPPDAAQPESAEEISQRCLTARRRRNRQNALAIGLLGLAGTVLCGGLSAYAALQGRMVSEFFALTLISVALLAMGLVGFVKGSSVLRHASDLLDP